MDASEIMRKFERHLDGSWTCLEPVTLQTAHGPVAVEPGQVFRYGEVVDDIDLAEILESLGAQHGS